MPKIKKSSRHSKITGDFSEHLVLYWLSKYGCECVHVDHTGIDLIACNPKKSLRMGISVKSRCRSEGAEGQGVIVRTDDMSGAKVACHDFDCEPYLALVVDAGNQIRCFVMSFDTFYKLYPRAKKHNINWSMTEKARTRYSSCQDVMEFGFTSETRRWL